MYACMHVRVCISLMYLHIMRTLCGLFNSLFNIKHCPIFCGLPSFTYIFFSCCCICHYYILCLTHTDAHNTYKCKQYSLRDPDPLQSNPTQSDVIHRCDFYIVPFIYRFVSYRFCCYRMVFLNAVMPDLSNINYIHKYLKIKIHGHLQFKEFLLFTLTILYLFKY